LWNYISSPADILTGTSELRASGGSIQVRYLDFLSSMNFFTTDCPKLPEAPVTIIVFILPDFFQVTKKKNPSNYC
jgi:hypothetical protein